MSLTCAERDAIVGDLGKEWRVESSLTDAEGEYGEPRIETTWYHSEDGRRIKDVRHPRRGSYSPPDERPCEHYQLPTEEPHDD